MLPQVPKRKLFITIAFVIIDCVVNIAALFSSYCPLMYCISGILASAALLIWLYCVKQKLKALALVSGLIVMMYSTHITISAFVFYRIEFYEMKTIYYLMHILQYLMPNIALLFPMLFTLRKRNDNKAFFIVATIIAFVGAAFSWQDMLETFKCLAVAVVFMPKFDGLSRQSATSESALERFKREHGMK